MSLRDRRKTLVNPYFLRFSGEMMDSGSDSGEIADFSEKLRHLGRQLMARRDYLGLDRAEVAHILRTKYGVRASKNSMDRIEIGRQNFSIKGLLSFEDLYESDLCTDRWFQTDEQKTIQGLLNNEKLNNEIAEKLKYDYSPEEIVQHLIKALRDLP